MQKIFEYDLIFLLKKIPYLWFFSILNGLTNFLLFVILARYLSIDNYGLFYSSFILLSFFSSFTGFGLDTLILKFFGKYKKELLKFRKNFIFYFIFTSVISIIFYLITILLLKTKNII